MGFRSSNHDYVYFAGRRIARYDSGGTVYYLYDDANGSLRTMTDASGNQLCWADYYPFGEPVSGTGCSGDNYQFAGLYSDATGEDGGHSAAQRRYNDTYYRWFSPDPAGQKAVNLANPQTWNMYAYVADNPTTLNDPSGLLPPGPPGAGDEDGCSPQNAPGDCPKAHYQNGITDNMANGAISTGVSTFTTANGKGGTRTITETTTTVAFSDKHGEEGKLLSSTQTITTTVLDRNGNSLSSASTTNSIGYGEARSIIGAAAVDNALQFAGPSTAGYFLPTLGRDVAAHPYRYALHAVGLAMPFLDIPVEAEGVATGIEAIITAHDLEAGQ